MEGKDQQQQQHHGAPQQPMHPPPPAIYGYPVDPSWGGHGMIHPHQMHQGYPHPMQFKGGAPLPPGIPGLGASTDPLEGVLGPFPCARLRNLPFDATLEDILVLFQGLVIIDVVLLGEGQAFVIFANPMDYQMALQRDRQSIGRNFIEIFQGSRTEYYAAIASQQWQEQQREPQLLSGDFLLGFDKVKKGIDSSATWGSIGVPAPIQPLNQLPGKVAGRGTGPVGLQMSGGRGGGAGRGAIPGGQGKRSGGGIQEGEHTGFLRMRGLPFSSTKEDIFKFFESHNPVLDSIVLTYRSDGRATGEAYVGFESPDDSKSAMELHRKSMGTRYIELFLSNKEEHGRALTRFGNR